MPAGTLGKWWTGSRGKFLVGQEGDLAVLHNRNKMVNALPPQNGLQVQKEQSSHEVSLLVLE